VQAPSPGRIEQIGAPVSKPLVSLAALAGASLLLAACGGTSYGGGSSSSAAPSAAAKTGSSGTASAGAVKTASNPKLGATILVNSGGMTLYRLSAETGGKFICTSTSCLAVWHPLAAAAGSTPSGASSLSVVKRPDGSAQVAYKGQPLYTFASDAKPGDTSGQGVKDVGTWNAVTVGGGSAAAGSAAGGSPSSSSEMGYGEGSSSSGAGYHY
jgi:predicted lipoprotein with Yx(FWY)xxD motif